MKWLLMPFQRLTDVAGRSRRTEFWVFWLAALVLQMLASFVDSASEQTQIVAGMAPVTLTITLIFTIPAAAVGIRRLHDTGRSGWFMLLFAAPYAAWLYVTHTGAPPLVAAISLLVGSVVLLVLLVQPGTVGDNRFGADPKGGVADGAKAR